MSFDARSRRSAQGIRRAVEVMEMSSTKTPQRLTRYDEFRERKSRNQRIAALVVGIAVPLLLVIGAVRLVGSNGDGETPADQPSSTVTAPPESDRSIEFDSPFSYAIPDSWVVGGEGDRYSSFETPGASGTDVIVLSNVVAAKSDCSHDPMPGVGTSSEAITNWLSTHPALDATAPQPVTMGAATGRYVDVQLADGNQPCGRDGITLVTAQPSGGESWEIIDSQQRIYVLDLPSGDTVTVVIDENGSGTDFESLIDEAAPVVESFSFD